MKTTVLILSILSSSILYSQEYKDLIITKTNDTINCNITLVNESSLFYDYLKRNTKHSKYISLNEVLTYSNDGNQVKSVVVVDIKNRRGNINLAGDELHQYFKNKQLSMLVMLGGLGLTMVGMSQESNGEYFIYSGGLVMVASFAVDIGSISKLGRSSKYLKEYETLVQN